MSVKRTLRREQQRRVKQAARKHTTDLAAFDEFMRMADTIKKLYLLLKVSWVCAVVLAVVAVAGWLR